MTRCAAPPRPENGEALIYRFRSMGRRFGALFVVLVGLIGGVCALVVVHVGRMRTDSERVLEETRELVIATGLTSDIGSLRPIVAAGERPDPHELKAARETVAAAVETLDHLHAPVNDPSREEHQEAENRIAVSVRADVVELGSLLETLDVPADAARAGELLEHARHYASVLAAETRNETHLAHADLSERATTTRTVLVATSIAAALVLGFALLLVFRTVVRPLRIVRKGAERFGRDDLSHRIRVKSRDEIGALARSFNEMADRVASTQADLETRVRERTSEFLRAARLADLGLLASGVAHEINTPLASITSCAEGLERRIHNGGLDAETANDYVSTITREAYRARDITERMLALSRQEPCLVGEVALDRVLRQVESAVQHTLEQRGVRLERDAPAPDDVARVNAGELVQILVNLVLNAIDASSQGQVVRLGAKLDGESLRFDVADDGSGIPPEDLERIFEPFYTTKRPGRGTGLGLALVATLVDAHGGHIGVTSRPGEGSRFVVTLPRRWEEGA